MPPTGKHCENGYTVTTVSTQTVVTTTTTTAAMSTSASTMGARASVTLATATTASLSRNNGNITVTTVSSPATSTTQPTNVSITSSSLPASSNVTGSSTPVDLLGGLQDALQATLGPVMQRLENLETNAQHVSLPPQSIPPQMRHTSHHASDTESDMSVLTDESSGHVRRKKEPKRKSDKKSSRLRTSASTVKNGRVEWPHFGVYKGPACEPAEYDSLTLAEFTFGYLETLKYSREDKAIKAEMLNHLQNIMEDASLYPWTNVRNFHGVVLSEMERGRLSWMDREKIQTLRIKYAQKHFLTSFHAEINPCPAFQTGTCDMDGDHDNVRHVCAHCLNSRAKVCPHPMQTCYGKHGRPQGRRGQKL